METERDERHNTTFRAPISHRLTVRRIASQDTPPAEKDPSSRHQAQIGPRTTRTDERPMANTSARTHAMRRRSDASSARSLVARLTERAARGLAQDHTLSLDDQRMLGARIYRIKSYTTVGKVARRYAHMRKQRVLQRVLTYVLLIVIVIVLFVLYNPFKDVADVHRLLGIGSPYDTAPSFAPTTTASNHP